MDVSFTNVLEDARPYFQGLPSPVPAAASTAAAVAVATSTSSSSAPIAPSPSQQHQMADNSSSPRYAQPAAPNTSAAPSVLAYWPPPPATQTSPGPTGYARAKDPQSQLYGSSVYNGARVEAPQPAAGGYQLQGRAQGGGGGGAPAAGGGGHNLPPIAALSSYHSNRSSRLNIHHHQAPAPAKPPPAPQARPQPEYVAAQQQSQYGEVHYGHRGVAKYQQHGGVLGTAPPPPPPLASSTASTPPYGAYAAVSSTLSTPTSPSAAYQVSSNQQQYAYGQHHVQQMSAGDGYAKVDQQHPKMMRQQYPSSQVYYGTTGASRALPTPAQQHSNTSLQNGHQRLSASSSTTPTTVVNTVVRSAPAAPISRSKRESPLDLSVKTVRQSADSTAKDDAEGMYGLSSFSPTISGGGGGGGGGKVMTNHMRSHAQQQGVILPPLQLPSSVPYPAFERSPRQSQANASPAQPTSTVGAPKVDFLPNFSASHHSSSQQLEMVRNSSSRHHHHQQQQQHAYSQQTQALPHVGSINIKKSSSTTTTTTLIAATTSTSSTTTTTTSMMNSHPMQYYSATMHPSQQHRNATDSSPGSNVHPPFSLNSNHQYIPSSYETGKKVSEPTAGYNKGRLDYADVRGPNHIQAYSSVPPPLGQKRICESARHSVAAKVPKIDSWRDAIDMQIEQRLSSYTNARAQQQMQQQHLQQQQQGLHLQQQQHQQQSQQHLQQHLQQQHQQQQHQQQHQQHQQQQHQHHHNNHQVNGVLVNNSSTNHIAEQQYPSQHRQSLQHQTHQQSNHILHHSSATSRSPVAPTTPSYNPTIPHQNTSPYAPPSQQQPLQKQLQQQQLPLPPPQQQQQQLQQQPLQTQQQQKLQMPQLSQQPPFALQHGAPLPPPRGNALQQLLMSSTTGGGNNGTSSGVADKHVLSVLRTSLEIREARISQLQNELQVRQRQKQMSQYLSGHQPQADVQQKVAASTAPNSSSGRPNVPTYSTDNNCSTPMHKLHLPKAVDSICLESESRPAMMHPYEPQKVLHRSEPKNHTNVISSTNTGIIATSTAVATTTTNSSTNSGDLDGLAAYLAARIRTKAELKQVGPSMDHLNITSQNQFGSSTPASSISASNSSAHSPRTTPGTPVVFSSPPPQQQQQQQQQHQQAHSSSDPVDPEQTPHGYCTTSTSGVTSASSVGTSVGSSPPKLTRERVNVSLLPRRRLFSPPDEEPGGSSNAVGVVSLAPPRDPSGLRSSSETSVFDFRDSDSDSEMPVLERQTLDEMRRDRKSHTKQAQISVVEFADQGVEPIVPIDDKDDDVNKEVDQKVLVSDPLWANMCDDFVEELKHGANRVNRWDKLIHSMTSPFVETVSSLKEENISIKVEIKEEVVDTPAADRDEVIEAEPQVRNVQVKLENDPSDSTPLFPETKNVIIIKNDTSNKNDLQNEIKIFTIKKEVLRTVKKDGELTKKLKISKKDKLVDLKGKDIPNKDNVLDKKGKQMEEREKISEKEKFLDKEMVLEKNKDKASIKKEKFCNIKSTLGKIEKTLQKKDKISDSKNLKINIKADGKVNKIENSSSKEKKRKQDDSDEDVPLVRRSRGRPRKKIVPEKEVDKDVEDEISLAEMKARLIKIEPCRDASVDCSSRSEGCDSECDEQVSMIRRLRCRKGKKKLEAGMKLRSKDSVTPKKLCSPEKKSTPINKKNQSGDTSDFQPGWEEEVYSYKRSLRMPPKLISIPRPSNRLCSSLPDLDAPVHSPAASTMDSFDFLPHRRGTDASNLLSSHRTWSSVRSEMADSDLDSNSNFSSNWSLPQRSWNAAPDSEEASSSTTFSTKNKCKISDNNYALLNRIASKLSSSSLKDKSSPDAKDNGKNSPCIFTRSASNTPELLLRTDSSKSKGRKSSKKNFITKPDVKEVGKNCLKENKNVCDSDDLDAVGVCRKDKVSQSFNNVLRLNSRVHAEAGVCISRTRGRTRVLRRKATIRAVFGADRPASAPPVCQDDRWEDCVARGDRAERTREGASKGFGSSRSAAVVWNSKAVSKSSKRRLLLSKQRHGHALLKILSPKKLSDGKGVLSKNSIGFADGDAGARTQLKQGRTITGKRIKLRTVRRKFRSGFDYIRKKKKQQKKEVDGDCPKEKKKFFIPRPSSESVQDIQNEIRGWVINKGLGETLLHRAARLGYTDVAAYCLEVLDNHPSPRDNAGYTPLHEACARGHLELARLLLMYGANVSDSAPGGVRPLHEVADNGFAELIRLLLSYGADPLLATYGSHTPLSLASEETSRCLLQYHLADVQGLSAPPWQFLGPSSCCDPKEYGYDPLTEAPGPVSPTPQDVEELEIETCEVAMPVLYRLCNEPAGDRWVLLQDLTSVLRFKSRDAVLRQLSTDPSVPPKSIFRELKMADFLEQARCCNLLGAGERINIRASKVALVKYTDKVRELLGIEKATISLR